MNEVFIDGQHGTAGLRLAALLRDHPGVESIGLPFEQRHDIARRRACMERAELVAFCLPASQLDEALALVPERRKVLDTSNRFRCDPGWTYGLPELGTQQREAIATATRVSNPGCFATAFLLAVRPLVHAGVVSATDQVHCFALTGYSAGGKRMISAHEAGEYTGCLHGLDLDHRHLPEMTRYSGLETTPIFVPSVGAHREGMHSVIPLCSEVTREELLATYRKTHAGSPFVSVLDDSPKRLEPAFGDSNQVTMYIHGQPGRHLVSVRLNNLMKGAAGTACQNINLMLGLEQTEGLR